MHNRTVSAYTYCPSCVQHTCVLCVFCGPITLLIARCGNYVFNTIKIKKPADFDQTYFVCVWCSRACVCACACDQPGVNVHTGGIRPTQSVVLAPSMSDAIARTAQPTEGESVCVCVCCASAQWKNPTPSSVNTLRGTNGALTHTYTHMHASARARARVRQPR